MDDTQFEAYTKNLDTMLKFEREDTFFNCFKV